MKWYFDAWNNHPSKTSFEQYVVDELDQDYLHNLLIALNSNTRYIYIIRENNTYEVLVDKEEATNKRRGRQ